ncbi:MAG: transcription antitermination protein NusB, partial [Planctomycetes bacterium]|nr:transcription antitermination protein NusB [Planctomycetota bacterium]
TDTDHAPPGDVERGMALAALAWEFHDDADREIATLAREWPPHRQPVVDRNLLRLGWYELRQSSEPPRKVVSDAVELAKEFGTADSGKFVNGVLDKIMNGVGADDAAGGDAEAVGEG